MTQPILKTIPLSELRISKLNMRHSRKKPDISDILPSIRESRIRNEFAISDNVDASKDRKIDSNTGGLSDNLKL